MSPRPRVGFIGLGAMGSALASRLTEPADLSVFDLEAVRAEPLVAAGAHLVSDLAELAARRHAENLLEESRRLDSLGRMAGTIAHELNNVLMMVYSAADQLRRDPAAALPIAERITEAVKRGQRITSEVMRFAKPAEPERQLLNLRTWLTAFVADLRATLGQSFALLLELPPEELHVSADRHQLEQVMTNLIVNARDAMPRGGTIIIRIDGAAFEGGALIEISVADTGAGMNEDTLSHIFEPLFTTRQHGTTGDENSDQIDCLQIEMHKCRMSIAWMCVKGRLHLP